MKMKKHSLLMMAGCGVMLVGLVLLPLFGVKLSGVLPLLFALACPLSMVFMMGAMGKGHEHDKGDGETSHSEGCHEHSTPQSAPRALPAPQKDSE
jgi:hypothetical protein